ncbi:MAG: UDP-N-acetylmuramoyl-L-alanine--D-glutamate ligase [Chlorobiales bacterium]|nr:UDP-N-acetylmuramoyl-L-alanine--D-glutamate ligase [Chlorobiales bacterium]
MEILEIKGKQAVVIGGRRSGMAAAKLLRQAGAKVFLSDKGMPAGNDFQKELERNHIKYEFGQHSEEVFNADFAIISPGVPSNAPVIKQLVRANIPIYSEIELASWFCKAKIVAVTGTDGKTTVTSLCKSIFETDGKANGYKAYSLGNIGLPFSDYVTELGENDVAVIETSSFQLDHCFSYKPKVAIITNITPDHLDRYEGDFKKYAAAKYRIYQSQDERDFLIYNDDNDELHQHFNSPEVRSGLKVQLVPISLEQNLGQTFDNCAYLEDGWLVLKFNKQKERLMEEREIMTKNFRGRHNIYNSLAAAAAARAMEIRKDVIRESIQKFEGVEHRLEFVRDINGIEFINDSKATTVNALWYALDTISGNIILIAGGRDKGNDYSKVAPLVKQKVKTVIAIGESSHLVDAAFRDLTKVMKAATMDEAVSLASREAEDGDTILLSPACASFDMFQNFEERGDVFKRLVANL